VSYEACNEEGEIQPHRFVSFALPMCSEPMTCPLCGKIYPKWGFFATHLNRGDCTGVNEIRKNSKKLCK
jgi:hypothetical protein